MVKKPAHLRVSIGGVAAVALALLALSACSSSRGPAPGAAEADIVARVTEGPPIPLATAGHIGGLVRGVPVVAGGSSWIEDRTKKRWNHECFAYRDGRWVPAPALPQPLSDAAYAHGRKGLYAVGGTNGKAATDAVLHLADPSSRGAWQRLTPLPETVEAASGALASDTLYVAGGFSDGRPSNRLWALNLSKPNASWRRLAPLPGEGRGYAALVAANDQLYLFGGFVLPPYAPKAAIFGDAYRYDPDADRWSKLDGFDLPGYAWTATAVSPRRIMLTGRVAEIGNVGDAILLLDLPALRVRPIGRLMIPGCCMPALPVAPRTWWLPGGEPDTNRSRTERTSIVKLEDAPDNE